MTIRRVAKIFALSRVLGPMGRVLTSNTGVVAGTALLQNLLRIAGSMALTRLLDADAYGVIGIVTSVTVTFAMVSDVGIMAFVIRSERSDEPRFLDEVWTIRLIRSAVLTLSVLIGSAPIASFLGKSDLRWPIAVGGLTFLIDGVSSMAFVTTLRQQKVTRLAVIDVSTQITGILVSVTLAYVFRNFWAILLAALMVEAIRTCLSYLAFRGSVRRWRLNRRLARELWTFAKFITGSTIITLLLSQTDKLILSKALTIDVLGLYVLAYNLATAPMGLANAYAQKILYPFYAKTLREAPATLAVRFYSSRMPASLLYTFAVGGLIATGPLVVRTLYDARYVQAGLFVQILAISALFYLSNIATNELMIARGKARFTFTVNVVRLLYLAGVGSIAFLTDGAIGLISVIGSIEFIAQIYGWFRLGRDGLLNWQRELAILVAGGLGYVVGSLVAKAAALA